VSQLTVSWRGCCLLYIRLPVVYGAFGVGLNDLLELVAFKRLLFRFLCRLFATPLFRSYFACLFCPGEVGVVAYYYAACSHCVIGIGPFIRIAVIACVTFPRAAILLLQNFGDMIFSCRS